MSDEWLFFPCDMDGNTAFIFFDHGVSETLNDEAGKSLLSVKVTFKESRDDGLPSGEEFTALNALEDDLTKLSEQHGAHYVGRITVNGYRRFQIFTDESEADWTPRIAALGKQHAYTLAMSFDADPEHKGYWEELYPTDDDWQVIADMNVLEALDQQGDDGTTVRPVEHWSYFPTQEEADQFAAWLTANDYKVDANGPVEIDADEGRDPDEEEDDRICVRFSHETAVTLGDITSHTLVLRQEAEAAGGEYDGWECILCADKAP